MAGPDLLSVDLETDADGCTLVRPKGELTTITCEQLRDVLLKCVTEIPAAVIVDVDRLAVLSPQSVNVFSAAWVHTADWPGVPILLVTGRPLNRALLAATWVDRYVPVHPDVKSAKRSLSGGPCRQRVVLALPWDATSPRRAGRFVTQTCASWAIDHQTGADAAAVAAELVENSVMHTHSAPTLRVELRRSLLTVAVSDADPAPAVITGRVQARGLHLVRYFAKAWGCTPTTDGGKVVWAVLRSSRL
jgi:hypothetical protein